MRLRDLLLYKLSMGCNPARVCPPHRAACVTSGGLGRAVWFGVSLLPRLLHITQLVLAPPMAVLLQQLFSTSFEPARVRCASGYGKHCTLTSGAVWVGRAGLGQAALKPGAQEHLSGHQKPDQQQQLIRRQNFKIGCLQRSCPRSNHS